MSSSRAQRALAWLGMGTTIGLGATIGILLGMWVEQIILGMMLGSAAGVAIGAGLEQRRRSAKAKE